MLRTWLLAGCQPVGSLQGELVEAGPGTVGGWCRAPSAALCCRLDQSPGRPAGKHGKLQEGSRATIIACVLNARTSHAVFQKVDLPARMAVVGREDEAPEEVHEGGGLEVADVGREEVVLVGEVENVLHYEYNIGAEK